METENLLSLVEHLEDNIDELEENLEPLLSVALTATAQKLPLLGKAKLYVLIVYSIESLLFSYLRLNGVKAKDHPVFKELTRVKQYFEKIKKAEEGPTKPRENLSLDKHAAARVIKHALAGNNKYDLERAERAAKEKVLAKRKLQSLERGKHPQPEPPPAEKSPDESEASEEKAEDGEVDEAPVMSSPASQPNNQPSNKNYQATKKGKKQKPRKPERKRKGKVQNGVGSEPKPKKKRKASKGKNKQS